MTDKKQVSREKLSPDWFMQGALARIGDTLDRFLGRNWTPTSSLATSGLIERLKKLLDAEAKEIPGKGTVVPHNIKLKMQWDKFSTDSQEAIAALETELLTAAADHINDSLYYTYAPLKLEVKPDYFTEGVKLLVSFEAFSADEGETELNVTLPVINIDKQIPVESTAPADVIASKTIEFTYKLNGVEKRRTIEFVPGSRISVGRAGGNDLVIDDTSVSKIHASLVMAADGSLALADTGSTNGTFVNDRRISYGTATQLDKADKVRFGTVKIAMQEVAPSADDSQPDGDDAGTAAGDGLEFTSRPPAESLPTDTVEMDSDEAEDDGEKDAETKAGE